MVLLRWQEKVLGSDHPTEFDKQGETDEPDSAKERASGGLGAGRDFWGVSEGFACRRRVRRGRRVSWPLGHEGVLPWTCRRKVKLDDDPLHFLITHSPNMF